MVSLIPVPHDAIEVNINTTGLATAGEYYNMTCTVFKTVDGLMNSPLATWTIGEIPVAEGNNIQLIMEAENSISTSTIVFDPLKTSNAVPQGYFCQGHLVSPALSVPLTTSIHHQLSMQSE